MSVALFVEVVEVIPCASGWSSSCTVKGSYPVGIGSELKVVLPVPCCIDGVVGDGVEPVVGLGEDAPDPGEEARAFRSIPVALCELIFWV